jgi:chorismate mutase
MNDDFLLVNKAILPDVLPQVIQARVLIEKEDISVTKACQTVGISRSAYYKYKDSVYLPDTTVAKKAMLAFKVDDEPGVLDALLKKIYDFSANVITIHQDMPIQHVAFITMTLNINDITVEMNRLVQTLADTDHVRKAQLISYE